MPDARYAIYYAPPRDSRLWIEASRWLGRDAASGGRFDTCPSPALDGETWREIVGAPAVYGFHATLKPPFFLADGVSVAALESAAAAIAGSAPPNALPPLQLSRLGRFLALTLSAPCPALDHLAARCVEELDAFRRPATPAELDRRRSELTPRQNELLDRWGYPYVLDQWKFHLTLTSNIASDPLRETVFDLIASQWAEIIADIQAVRDLCLFIQPAPGEPFTLAKRFPLAR